MSRCDVSAHTGLAAVPLGPFLRKATLALYPWSSLTLDGLVVEDCLFAGGSEALHGIRLDQQPGQAHAQACTSECATEGSGGARLPCRSETSTSVALENIMQCGRP